MQGLANLDFLESPLQSSTKIVPVVLCGGSGTRLWPVSRRLFPKQFCSLLGNETLFQQTVKRFLNHSLFDSVMVVANKDHRFLVERDLKNIGIKDYRLILEPCGRNTTPAITLACLDLLKQGTDPFVLALPSDHYIEDPKTFLETVIKVTEDAKTGALVTFGIQPTRPETGYGYIHYDVKGSGDGKKVFEFVEKPNLALAESYCQSKEFLWNSGIFFFKASAFINEVATFQPEILDACNQALLHSSSSYPKNIDLASFEKAPSISVDYGVMEKSKSVRVAPLEVGWCDLGSWEALWENNSRDEHGNSLSGDVVACDVENSFVRADSGRLVGVVGVEDLVVVDSQDAVLVASKSACQDVKKLVDLLQGHQRSQAQQHLTEHRPWGSFQRLDLGETFQVKRITVQPGQKLSLQLHHHRAEHWIVVRGIATVTVGEETFILKENQSTYIPVQTAHRLENTGDTLLELIEVQCGSYLGEDDIVRLEDIYGRAAS